MTKADKDEIRELINDILAVHSEKIEGKFNLITEKLERIETQTTKTNGRVNRLEADQSQHIINCPVAPKVAVLEKAEEFKKGQLRAVTVVSSVVATIAAIIISIAAIYFNK